MLISRCVEDISRYAAGDMDLQHTTETLINDMDRTETLGIRSFIVNNSRAIRRRLFPDLEDYEHIGYDGGSKDMINRKRLIGNTYQIYRSILHQLAIDENWNNVYSDITLPSGDMGMIKVCAGRGGSRYHFPCGEERGGFLLVEIDRQFFDEMINRFNNNNIKIDRI